MEFFKNISNSINNAKDNAYKYVDTKATELHADATKTINELDEGVSYLNEKIRNEADEFIDEAAERNQVYYTDMKDDVKESVSIVAEQVGMEKTGVAINEKIESGAEIIQSAGEVITEGAHERVKNFGTFNLERKAANDVLDAVATEKIENKTLRQVATFSKGKAKKAVNTNLADLPAEIAKTGVDGAALAVKTKVAMRDPIPNADELKIGQTKVVAADIKMKAHEGIGGGVSYGNKVSTERHGEDDFSVTMNLKASAKVGVGLSAGEGFDANVGGKLGTKVTVRGSAKMLEMLKESYKNGDLTMENLQKMAPKEIKVGGAIGHFVDGAAVAPSMKAEIGLSTELVWTEADGYKAQVSAKAKVSAQIGAAFSADLPGDRLDMPNLSGAFELSGTVKTDGTIVLKATAASESMGKTYNAEGSATVNLKTIGLSKEEVLASIKNGQFDPNEFGIKLKFKSYTTKVVDGGIAFDSSLGGIKNQTIEKEMVLEKEITVLEKPMNAFHMGMRF